mmetsp:Transcript_116382/g.232034  ORF Transcript_116382/g.232034 Transcript_116382/m.232034 type:complete len:252 (-) Transcript_116382:1001-1756(-)
MRPSKSPWRSELLWSSRRMRFASARTARGSKLCCSKTSVNRRKGRRSPLPHNASAAAGSNEGEPMSSLEAVPSLAQAARADSSCSSKLHGASSSSHSLGTSASTSSTCGSSCSPAPARTTSTEASAGRFCFTICSCCCCCCCSALPGPVDTAAVAAGGGPLLTLGGFISITSRTQSATPSRRPSRIGPSSSARSHHSPWSAEKTCTSVPALLTWTCARSPSRSHSASTGPVPSRSNASDKFVVNSLFMGST